MLNVIVSVVSLIPRLFVEAYIDIELRVHASGIGAPRAGSSPAEVEAYVVKKVPVPVHHLGSEPPHTPVTRKVALVPGAPAGPVAPVNPMGPIGPIAPAAPAAPAGPSGPIAPAGPAGPVAPAD